MSLALPPPSVIVRRPAPGVKLIKNVRIPMADGIRLAADLYLPDDGRDDFAPSAPLPVVMDYIPYRKDEVNPRAVPLYHHLARHDYILARVDIRGTGASEGSAADEYTLEEQTDGEAAVEWLAAQPWCDGHVLIGGWRDGYPNPPLRLYGSLTARGLPVKVLMGPWNHAYPDSAIPGPRIDHLREVVRWLDHWCKGAQNGVMDESPVVVYMQASEAPVVDRLESAGEWRAETAWPAPGSTARTLRLAAGGRLTDGADAGAEAPNTSDDGADTLAYHPAVGVTGGLWSGGIQFGLPGDQRPDEALSLVYTSDPLAEELAILGSAHADLVVESSASVVGFAVSLSDVGPDGSSHLIAKGMLDAARLADGADNAAAG